MRALGLLVVALIGCQAHSGGAGDMAAGDAVTLTMNAIRVAPGVDATFCATMRIAADVDVVAIRAAPPAGAHHLILYRSTESAAHDAMPCDSMTALADNVPLFVTQQQPMAMRLPAGAAYHFAAGELVKLELHALNATPAPLTVNAAIALEPAPAGASPQRAGVLACGSNTQLQASGVPPRLHSFTLAPGFFAGDSNIDFTHIRVFGMAGHQHWTGREVTLSQAGGGDGGATLRYDNTIWDTPGLTVFSDGEVATFGAGQGVRWQCSYDSADAVPPPAGTVYFGDRPLRDEVCYAWIYYFPEAQNPVDCAQ